MCVYIVNMCRYHISTGRCDSSPDSRSMPTVDLQWWLSSTDVFCRGKECRHVSFWLTLSCDTTATIIKHTLMSSATSAVYLIERCQVVSGLDEEGLVDSGMVHVVGGCCHQTQEHIQRAELLCQLQNRERRHLCNLSILSPVSPLRDRQSTLVVSIVLSLSAHITSQLYTRVPDDQGWRTLI